MPNMYVGWDLAIALNGIDWPKVHWDIPQKSLVLNSTGALVTEANKPEWQQFSNWADCRVAYQARFGYQSKFLKFYDYGEGISRAVSMYKTYGANTRFPLICHDRWDLADPTADIAAFNTALNYFGSVNRPWVVVYYHEPQYPGQAGVPEAQPSYYLQVYSAMNAVRAAHPSGHLCYMMKNLFWPNRYPLDAGHLWPSYDGGQRFERFFVGMDLYSDERKPAPMDGPALVGALADWSAATGYQAVVPEFAMAQNYGVVKGDNNDVIGTMMTGAEHAAAIKEIIDYCRAHRFGWINYWNPNSECTVANSGYAHWELQTPETIAYWSGQMAINPNV